MLSTTKNSTTTTSGEPGSRVIDVAATIGDTDALSRESGEALAGAVLAADPGGLVLDFSAVGSVNSAFMAAFLLTVVERLGLSGLREKVRFKGLSSRGAEVVRGSIARVRELAVSGSHEAA